MEIGLTVTADFKLSKSLAAADGERLFTATATAPDAPNGSTSEFSPCVKLGQNISSFRSAGVPIEGAEVTAGPSNGTLRPLAVRSTARKTKNQRYVGFVYPFCPPHTARDCVGTITLAGKRHHRIATLRFKLIPNQLGRVTFKVPLSLVKLLKKRHHATLDAVIAAQDGAKHPNKKTTHATVTFTLLS
ncbi:MAG: hypothetical protein JOZ89_07085 [Gammaproteobacteria bacterium]|nr:hypothetical protein [Gammaproteobacteria bacterium]